MALALVMAACGSDSTNPCPEGTIPTTDGHCVAINGDNDWEPEAEPEERDELEEDGDILPDEEVEDVVEDQTDPEPEPDVADEVTPDEPDEELDVAEDMPTDEDPDLAEDPDEVEEEECVPPENFGTYCQGDDLWRCASDWPPPCGGCTKLMNCPAGCLDSGDWFAFCATAPDGDETDGESCEQCEVEGGCGDDGFYCKGSMVQSCTTVVDQCGCNICQCTDMMFCEFGCVDWGHGTAYCNSTPQPDGDEVDGNNDGIEIPDEAPCVCIDDSDCDTGFHCDGCYCVGNEPDGDEEEVDEEEDFLLCYGTTDCPLGYYCAGIIGSDPGYCTYQCRINEDCPTAGQICNQFGLCVYPGDQD